jgi:hypothetical protein
MFATLLVAIAAVPILNVIHRAPAGTVTVAGTVAIKESLASDTIKPPSGATPLRVTVPVEIDPPTIDTGETDIFVTTDGSTFNCALTVTPIAEAEMVATLDAATLLLRTAKDAVLAPEGIVTLAGTTAKAESDANETTNPPVGAGESIAIAAVELDPSNTVFGLRVRVRSCSCPTIVSTTDFATDPQVTVIVTGSLAPKSVLGTDSGTTT